MLWSPASSGTKLPVRSIWGVLKIQGYHFGGLHKKDCSILGSILGFPYFGKLPYRNYITGFRVFGLCKDLYGLF